VIKTATEMVMVERVDADVFCDGLGLPNCSASLSYTLDGDEDPKRAAEDDGWLSIAGLDLCPACRRQPHRHPYVEPTSGPRWDTACKVCDRPHEQHLDGVA
jgi:hypothetical protein